MPDPNTPGQEPAGTPIDIAKMRTVGTISRQTRDRVVEGRRPDGVRTKAVTDQLGNTTTEHARDDRVDVLIRAPTVAVQATTTEVRN